MSKPEITSLCFSYNGGMEIESNYSYSVLKDSEGYHLQVSLNSGNLEIDKEIDQDKYEELIRLFDEIDLFIMNGDDDHYRDMRLFDVAMFSFSASFSDGTESRIHSALHAPEGYAEAVDAFRSMVKPIVEEVKKNDDEIILK